MQIDAFTALIGLRLSIIRRAADMLVLHFGAIRAHPSGSGTIGEYALHVQCPWRLDGPAGTVTGSGDLWEYAGPGDRPPNWTYEDGFSLQDQMFGNLFARDENTQSWVNESDRFAVIATDQTKCGDVKLGLANGYTILLFPASRRLEAWRLFSPGRDRHIVFPTTASDFAISRRKRGADNSDWEVWLRVVESPKVGHAMQAPPPVILAANGARYRCGRCGTILAIAEFGSLKDFVVHCRVCDHYNEATL